MEVVIASSGNGCNGGCGDNKWSFGGMNCTKRYCWVKYNKTEYVHQVIDGIKQLQFTSVLVGRFDQEELMQGNTSKRIKSMRTEFFLFHQNG